MEKPQQWQKVKEIVGSALERPPAQRAAYVDQACSQDRELRKEVESLLSLPTRTPTDCLRLLGEQRPQKAKRSRRSSGRTAC